jgi:hypothetical protein
MGGSEGERQRVIQSVGHRGLDVGEREWEGGENGK